MTDGADIPEGLADVLAPSVRRAYLSACAFLGRRADGRSRRRVIAEAQGVFRRQQAHQRAASQANAAAQLRKAERAARLEGATA